MSIQENSQSSSRVNPAWVALAHVMPCRGKDLLEGARGAYVNAVGPAQSAQEFEHRLRELFASLGGDLIEVDDLELISERQSKHALTEELQEAAELCKTTNEIQLGDLHTYDDADDLM